MCEIEDLWEKDIYCAHECSFGPAHTPYYCLQHTFGETNKNHDFKIYISIYMYDGLGGTQATRVLARVVPGY